MQPKWNVVIPKMFQNEYIGSAPYMSCLHFSLSPKTLYKRSIFYPLIWWLEYFKQSGSGLSGLEVYGEVSGCGAPENTLSRSCFPCSHLVIFLTLLFLLHIIFFSCLGYMFSLRSYVIWRSKPNIEKCISWKFAGWMLDYRTHIGNAFWVE